MSETNSNLNALIVGGGPVGWLSALALAKKGTVSTLVARDEPLQDLRTVALMQGSLAFLDELGLDPQSIDDATALETMRLIDGTKRLIRAPEVNFVASEIGHPYFALNIPVSGLVKRIQEKLATFSNFTYISGAVDHVSFDNGVKLTLANSRVLTADFVVGADGRNSKIRDCANISSKKWTYPQTAFITQFQHNKPHNNISTEFHTETGPFTLVPLSGQRSSVVCVVKPDEAENLMQMCDSELTLEMEKRSRFLLGKLSDFSQRQIFPMSSQISKKMASGRVFLVGESGHAFPPIGAQGLNLGIRDVQELGRRIQNTSQSHIEKIADAYNKARRLDVTTRTMGVDALNRSLLTDFLPVQSLRCLGLFATKNIAPVRKAMMREGLGAYSS
ncbi:MAG: FAD-dependent monooxygenase [Hyphomicrobiales bacterium]